jgi:hypothetical protein
MTLGVHGAAMQAAAHMPLRKIADSGIIFGLGTDATIVSHYSPFVTLGWVVSGLDVGGNKVLDETLTREEALVAHTRSNAYLFFQENALGSLDVGKQADLLVLDRDYMTVPAAAIKQIRPTLTMVGGRVVYDVRTNRENPSAGEAPRDREVIALVGLAHGTSHFFHLMLPPLFPWLMRDFSLSYTDVGLLTTTFFVISGVGQALAGFVVDRVGGWACPLFRRRNAGALWSRAEHGDQLCLVDVERDIRWSRQ